MTGSTESGGGGSHGRGSGGPGGSPDLSVQVGDVELQNPVLVASGTFGYGEEFAELIDLDALGGIVVKGLSAEPERGNPTPRIAETPVGVLNSIGLQNVGADRFLEEKLPFLRRFRAATVANVWGRTVEEYEEVVRRLDGADGLAAIELNVSCPNIKEGGINFGTDPGLTERVTAAARRVTEMPLWVKLSPGVTDIGTMGRAAERGGADALSVINTIRGMTIRVETRQPTLATVFGGYSGPAIFPIALYLLYEVRRATSLPLLGIGGIQGLDEALQFLIAGATAVQVGTANFYDPEVSVRLVDELRDWCGEEGLESVRQVVDTMRSPEEGPAEALT